MLAAEDLRLVIRDFVWGEFHYLVYFSYLLKNGSFTFPSVTCMYQGFHFLIFDLVNV